MTIRMIAASGQLGYGFNEASFERAMAMQPDFIGCDGGSMDPGPWYLGAGKPFVSERAMRRDLELLMDAACRQRIPLIIGSAGGGGGDPHVDIVRDVVLDIAASQRQSFRLAVIRSELSHAQLHDAIDDDRVEPLGAIAPLTHDEVTKTTRVVAMMGAEPIQQALNGGADVVIAGRCTDAAIYAAIPLMRGFNPGLCWHLAKTIECGAQIIEPRTSQDCVVGTLESDSFVVEPGAPDRVCTRTRVAAHTLYENPSPWELREPAGTLDTREAQYEQVCERTVRVSGSRFTDAAQYTVKLEGVSEAGHRTVFVAGVRDPMLVRDIDPFVASCHDRLALEMQSLDIAPDDYDVSVRVYGKNAVMGDREPITEHLSHELGLVVEALGTTEDISRAAMARMRYLLLHTDFPGRLCISGNLGIPFSPSDMYVGPTWQFNVWHTLAVDDPLALFPIAMEDVKP